MPKVSVIIPTYNRKEYLPRAIYSVINQTFKDFEIIVVDDGSSDETKEIVASFIKIFPDKIKYLYQENSGQPSALNRGIKVAKGEYVSFLDDDDVFLPRMLEKAVHCLVNEGYDAVKTSCYKIYLDSNCNEIKRVLIDRSYLTEINNLFLELLKKNIIGNPTSLIKKFCLEEIGLFDSTLRRSQDWDLWIRVAKSGFRIKGLGEPLYEYFKFESRSSKRSTVLKTIECAYKIISKYSSEALNIDKGFRRIYADKLWDMARISIYEGNCFRLSAKCVLTSLRYEVSFKRIFNSIFSLIDKYLQKNEAGSFCNVLYVHGNSDIIGGQELSLISRIFGLNQLGYNCKVLIPKLGVFSDMLNRQKIPFQTFLLSRFSKYWPFSYFKTVFRIYFYCKKQKISILHCSGVYPAQYCLPVSKFLRIPCVIHVNTTMYSRHDFNSSLVRYADAVFCISEAVREHVLKNSRCLASKVHLSYNGIVEASVFEPRQEVSVIKKRYGIRSEERVVGQVSQVIPWKGIEYFVKAVKIIKERFSNVRFILIGVAPCGHEKYMKEIKDLINKLGLSNDIILTGFVENVYDYMRMLDVSVLCSLEEGLGRSLVESSALGKPIVGTRVAGIPETMVENKTGLLVPICDPDALAKAVISLLDYPDRAHTMGKNGEVFVRKRFSQKNHANEIDCIYRALLKRYKK